MHGSRPTFSPCGLGTVSRLVTVRTRPRNALVWQPGPALRGCRRSALARADMFRPFRPARRRSAAFSTRRVETLCRLGESGHFRLARCKFEYIGLLEKNAVTFGRSAVRRNNWIVRDPGFLPQKHTPRHSMPTCHVCTLHLPEMWFPFAG